MKGQQMQEDFAVLIATDSEEKSICWRFRTPTEENCSLKTQLFDWQTQELRIDLKYFMFP